MQQQLFDPTRVGQVGRDSLSSSQFDFDSYNKSPNRILNTHQSRGGKLTDPEHERRVLSESTPAIAAYQEDVPAILQQGFKTQHETGTSGGEYDPESRAAMEDTLYGGGQRPVYGYAAHGGVPDLNVGNYGDTHFMLKDRMKDRATVSGGDSRGGYGEVPMASWQDAESGRVPLSRMGFDHGRYSPSRADRGWSRTPTLNYNEAQFHGGVGTHDIESMVFSEPLEQMYKPKFNEYDDWRDEEYGDNYESSEFDGPVLDAATMAARDAGVPYRAERHIANATQFSLRSAAPPSPSMSDGWKAEYTEPIFADVEQFMPGQHHTKRDAPDMRTRLRGAYRGTR